MRLCLIIKNNPAATLSPWGITNRAYCVTIHSVTCNWFKYNFKKILTPPYPL